jgi:hypothetical protein
MAQIWRYLEPSLSRHSAAWLFWGIIVSFLSSTVSFDNLPPVTVHLSPRPPITHASPEHQAVIQTSPASQNSVGLGKVAYPSARVGMVGDHVLDQIDGLGDRTAVYDISAHTVYLPDGTMLEAHSGLGFRLDNPRYVHERMKGSTPPHVYELALRERPFHGVRALRLKPLGGDESIFGRKGLLAHTYMLGPKGDSNGCVVFKNYNAFLQAFKSGGVKHLAVVGRID